jgi:hypothetical protein
MLSYARKFYSAHCDTYALYPRISLTLSSVAIFVWMSESSFKEVILSELS